MSVNARRGTGIYMRSHTTAGADIDHAKTLQGQVHHPRQIIFNTAGDYDCTFADGSTETITIPAGMVGVPVDCCVYVMESTTTGAQDYIVIY